MRKNRNNISSIADRSNDSSISMRRRPGWHDLLRLGLVLWLGLLGAAVSSAQPPRFNLVVIGPPGSIANAVNNHAQVVGTTIDGPNSHATLWDPILGGIRLSPPSVTSSTALDVNDLGQVVGNMYYPPNPIHTAFLYENGAMADLNTLVASPTPFAVLIGANAINERGSIAGVGIVQSTGAWVGFRYAAGVADALVGLRGSVLNEGHDINELEVAAGQLAGATFGHAASFSTDLTDLGTLGGRDSWAYGINDLGDVVGASQITSSPSSPQHAFVYRGQGLTSLGTLEDPDAHSVAWSINNAGWIVGQAETSARQWRAFLFTDGTMFDLNELVDLDPGWTLMTANDVNDQGQIVGVARYNGELFAVMLTPRVYEFTGFTGLESPPALNEVTAGKAVAVRFSLGGDYGSAIFASGFPNSQPIACESSAVAPVEDTLPVTQSQLTFKENSGQYQYAWKSDASWAGTCRRLNIRLSDGAEHAVFFRFR